MPIYNAPVQDLQFVLHDVLNVSSSDVDGYGELEPSFTAAVLEEAGKLSSEVLAPLNPVGDTEGCTLENGVVRTPTGFGDAFEKIKEGGWNGLDLPEEYGGQNLPYVLSTAVGEIIRQIIGRLEAHGMASLFLEFQIRPPDSGPAQASDQAMKAL